MGENPKKLEWLAKNPLGIIALFISLIYGMSALLLGTSVGRISEVNQNFLIAFIILFPCAVLFCIFLAGNKTSFQIIRSNRLSLR